jgi:hypothetical protein
MPPVSRQRRDLYGSPAIGWIVCDSLLPASQSAVHIPPVAQSRPRRDSCLRTAAIPPFPNGFSNLGFPMPENDTPAKPAPAPLAPDPSPFENRIRELEQRLEAVQRKYSDRLICDALRQAYIDQGGKTSAAATAVLAMRAGAGEGIALDGKGGITFSNPGGAPASDADGVRLDTQSFVRNWLKSNPIFLGKDIPAGSGARRSEATDISADEIRRRIRSARSPEELSKLARDLGL